MNQSELILTTGILNEHTKDYLMLGDNKLSGSLPMEMQTLTNLRMIMLNQNQFTGKLQLPSATNLSKFSIFLVALFNECKVYLTRERYHKILMKGSLN